MIVAQYLLILQANYNWRLCGHIHQHGGPTQLQTHFYSNKTCASQQQQFIPKSVSSEYPYMIHVLSFRSSFSVEHIKNSVHFGCFASLHGPFKYSIVFVFLFRHV